MNGGNYKGFRSNYLKNTGQNAYLGKQGLKNQNGDADHLGQNFDYD